MKDWRNPEVVHAHLLSQLSKLPGYVPSVQQHPRPTVRLSHHFQIELDPRCPTDTEPRICGWFTVDRSGEPHHLSAELTPMWALRGARIDVDLRDPKSVPKVERWLHRMGGRMIALGSRLALDGGVRKALDYAAACLFDEVSEDIDLLSLEVSDLGAGVLSPGGPFERAEEDEEVQEEELREEPMLLQHLPAKYRGRYDVRFFRRLLVCVVVVGQKLRHQRTPVWSCVGEELAFRAIVDAARDYGRESLGWDEDDEEALDDYCERATEDADIEVLFNPRLDGVEDDPMFGMANLRFEDWFKAFNNRVVHPYLEEEDEGAGGEAHSGDRA